MYIDNYISDNISEEEMAKWQENNVLLVADTGLGKTWFVSNKLLDYANSINKKILYLCNRIALKKQVEQEVEGTGIISNTYQYFETNIERIEEYLTENHILVLDEAHYFGTDSNFNPKNQLLYEKIINCNIQKIFMTATPECLYLDDDFFQYKYEFKRKLNDYIKSCYHYNSDNTILKLINTMPANDKALYICTDIKKICNMANKLGKKSSVIIANSPKNETLYEKFDCSATFNEIVENSKFSNQVLLATTCIDNGVSLKMPDLKHIIIDVANPVTLKQALGRKRFIDSSDKINLYIKNWHNDELQGIINKKKTLYEMIDFWFKNDKNKFIEKYKIEEYDTKLFYTEIVNGQEITKLNKCYAFSLLHEKGYTTSILNQPISSNQKYLNYICNYLGIPLNKFISLEYDYDYEKLKSFIIENKNEKIYKDSIKYNEVIDIFDNTLLTYTSRTVGKHNIENFVKSLNSHQADYYFSFASKQESSGQYRKRQYWQFDYQDLNNLMDNA